MKNLQYFLSNFPDDLFTTDNETYYKEVSYGLQMMESQTCIIAGLARDCEQALVHNILRTERLGNMFDDYRIVVFENDSTDRTKELLTKWNENPRTLIQTTNVNKIRHKQDQSIERMTDMASYRTTIQNMVSQYTADYVILYDMDIAGGFSYEGIAHSIAQKKLIIGSNSLIFKDNKLQYYDSFALETFEMQSPEQKNNMLLERGEDLIEVQSCFGGLALYDYETYMSGIYDSYDCEHTCFHASINQPVYLNPNQIVLYNNTRYCI